MPLNLTKRPAQIGPSINTRTELHGDEKCPAVDIPVTGIFLDGHELNEILQDPQAHEALYTEDRGQQLEPRLQAVKPLVLDNKFEDAKVTLMLSKDLQLVMEPAKISKIALTPQVGGLTLMSCTIQGNPPEHADMLALLNQKIRLTVKNAELAKEGKADDPELPLDHTPQESPEGLPEPQGPAPVDDRAPDDVDPELSPKRRQIASTTRKAKKKGRSRES